MKLPDLDNLNPGTWFDFPDDEGKICLRVIPYEEINKINKLTVKKKPEYSHGQRFVVENPDDEQAFAMMWDYSIVAWEELYTADGIKLDCTKETKAKLMSRSPSFADFVIDCIAKLKESGLTQSEEAEKN